MANGVECMSELLIDQFAPVTFLDTLHLGQIGILDPFLLGVCRAGNSANLPLAIHVICDPLADFDELRVVREDNILEWRRRDIILSWSPRLGRSGHSVVVGLLVVVVGGVVV